MKVRPSSSPTINQPAALEIADGHLYATVNVLAGLAVKSANPFTRHDFGLRAGPNGKLVRWAL